MLRRPTSQKAFTLIEVMMAATVLVVGITGMIYSVTMGAEMLDTARKSQIAQQVIDEEISRVRVADWGPTLTSVPGTVSYPSDSTLYTIIVDQNGTPNGLAGDDNQKLGFALTDFSVDPDDDNKALLALAKGFTVQLNVTTPTPRANEYRIFSYSVQWTSTLGKPHSRQGTAYINRYGLSSSYKQ